MSPELEPRRVCTNHVHYYSIFQSNSPVTCSYQTILEWPTGVNNDDIGTIVFPTHVSMD